MAIMSLFLVSCDDGDNGDDGLLGTWSHSSYDGSVNYMQTIQFTASEFVFSDEILVDSDYDNCLMDGNWTSTNNQITFSSFGEPICAGIRDDMDDVNLTVNYVLSENTLTITYESFYHHEGPYDITLTKE